MSVLNKVVRKVKRSIYPTVERAFRALERSEMSRGATLAHIPYMVDRGGGLGTTTYAEWCYTIGMFQSVIFQNLPSRPIRMLDVGCGTGRLYLSARPYLTSQDTYLGIDINELSIQRASRLYTDDNVEFLLTPASNGYYAREIEGGPKSWPIEASSCNLVTALSVWTHLREEDWLFYLNEAGRVLEEGGRAIISFFVLDEHYKPEEKTNATSSFYPQAQNKWIFDKPAYHSEHWKYPSWADVPEVAIGVPYAQFLAAVQAAGLKLTAYYPGQWKDQPGFFFQDVAILEKSS